MLQHAPECPCTFGRRRSSVFMSIPTWVDIDVRVANVGVASLLKPWGVRSLTPEPIPGSCGEFEGRVSIISAAIPSSGRACVPIPGGYSFRVQYVPWLP